jgi:chorismate mutase
VSAGATGAQPPIPPELARMRDSIDNLDAAMIHIMAERFKITQEVGELKADRGLPPSDPGREQVQIARMRKLASDSHLDPEFAEKLLNFIVSEVVRHHTEISGSR